MIEVAILITGYTLGIAGAHGQVCHFHPSQTVEFSLQSLWVVVSTYILFKIERIDGNYWIYLSLDDKTVIQSFLRVSQSKIFLKAFIKKLIIKLNCNYPHACYIDPTTCGAWVHAYPGISYVLLYFLIILILFVMGKKIIKLHDCGSCFTVQKSCPYYIIL